MPKLITLDLKTPNVWNLLDIHFSCVQVDSHKVSREGSCEKFQGFLQQNSSWEITSYSLDELKIIHQSMKLNVHDSLWEFPWISTDKFIYVDAVVKQRFWWAPGSNHPKKKIEMSVKIPKIMQIFYQIK